ncbi:hypothetical protein FRC12_023352 [Ceratobasidium sp. 428]|nr:hypothetical protein FRC12_023352 [Ceratobasidium sp. 428]
MTCSTHDLSSRPLTVFTSCRFQRITKIFPQGRADIICGLIEDSSFSGEVAVKGFLLARHDDQQLIENELKTWRLLCPHPNIATFIGTAPINDYKPCYLPIGPVSDYYVNGNLSQFLMKTDPDRGDTTRRLQLLIGVARGLKHMHEKSVIHGDLKASNVVVDADGQLAKICDFGSSIIDCVCYDGPRDQEGTVAWDSPELYEEDDVIRTKQSDVWAFGCTALEIQMGSLPWDPEGNIDRVMARQLRGGYPAREEWLDLGEDEILHEVWGLMQECWNEVPSDRPTPSDLLPRLEALGERISAPVALSMI